MCIRDRGHKAAQHRNGQIGLSRVQGIGGLLLHHPGIGCLLYTSGLLPHVLAEPVAALALPFVGGHPFGHAVHYLAWENLKGVAKMCIRDSGGPGHSGGLRS